MKVRLVRPKISSSQEKNLDRLKTTSNKRLLIVIDFSQLELRVMGIFCKDPLMTEVMSDPEGDIHQTTSDRFGVPRNPTAKQLNFLLLYGGGPFMLAQKLTIEGVPTDEQMAKSYLDQYNSTYHRVREFREEMFDFHREKGFFPNLIGRKIIIENLNSKSHYLRHRAETQCANNVIQSSGQDLLKASIVRSDPLCLNPDAAVLQRFECSPEHTKIVTGYSKKLEEYREEFRRFKLWWLLQVHDEVVYEVDAAGAESCLRKLSEIMTWRPYFEPVTTLTIPIRVEGGIGRSWQEAKSKNPLFHLAV